MRWSIPWRVNLVYREDRQEGYLEVCYGFGRIKGFAWTKRDYGRLTCMMKTWKFKKWTFWFYHNIPFVWPDRNDQPSKDIPRILPRWKELDDYTKLAS